MPVASVGDVELYHERWNDDPLPRVVFVGGSGSDLRRFPTPADLGFADGLHLLAYDHRGLGRSTSGPQPPTMADFAADLLGLLDHVGWDSCAMIGVSFGGMVGLEAAVTSPERFERVVLACTSPGGELPSHPLHHWNDLDPEQRRQQWVDVLDVRNAVEPARREKVLDILRARDDQEGDRDLSDGQRAQLLARAHHDVQDRIDALTMPTMIAAGRYDGIAPPENQRWLHDHIAGSELVWFEGGHAFYLEDRSAVPAMRGFVGGA